MLPAASFDRELLFACYLNKRVLRGKEARSTKVFESGLQIYTPVLYKGYNPMITLREAWEYDVALSFAGEDRAEVEKLAQSLLAKRVRTFYDNYEQANLWGRDLYQHLQLIGNCLLTLRALMRHQVSPLTSQPAR